MRTIFSSIYTAFHSFSFILPKKYSETYIHLSNTQNKRNNNKKKNPEGTNKGTKKCVYFFASDLKNIKFILIYINDVSFSLVQPHCGVKNKKKRIHRWTLTASSLTRKRRYVSLDLPHAFKTI